MPTLTGFREVSTEASDAAKKRQTLKSSVSPFSDGLVLKITGYTFKVPEEDGKVKKDAKPVPVFTTTVGADIFVRTMNRPVATVDKIVEHDGTFNIYVLETIRKNPDKNDGEVLQLIVDECKDKELIVRRKLVTMRGVHGDYARTILEFDFVVN